MFNMIIYHVYISYLFLCVIISTFHFHDMFIIFTDILLPYTKCLFGSVFPPRILLFFKKYLKTGFLIRSGLCGRVSEVLIF